VLYGRECFLKAAAQAVTKYARSGRTSCKPKRAPDDLALGGTEPSLGVAGPLRALLDTPNTTLTLALGGNASARVLRVRAADDDGRAPCALYVKPVGLEQFSVV
jgi:hypothetical protein